MKKKPVVRVFKEGRPQKPGDKATYASPEARMQKEAAHNRWQAAAKGRRPRVHSLDRPPVSDCFSPNLRGHLH